MDEPYSGHPPDGHSNQTLKAMTDQPGSGPATCSRKEAAAYIGVSTRTFDRIQEAHDIPYVSIGRRRRYLISDLSSYIKSRRSI